MSATQAERRSTINHELFTITDEMREAMGKARTRHLDSFPAKKIPAVPTGTTIFGRMIRISHFL